MQLFIISYLSRANLVWFCKTFTNSSLVETELPQITLKRKFLKNVLKKNCQVEAELHYWNCVLWNISKINVCSDCLFSQVILKSHKNDVVKNPGSNTENVLCQGLYGP